MKNPEAAYSQMVSSAETPAGVKEVMKVFERFQEAYVVTEEYLGILSPKTHQTNSNQSFLIENK